MVGNPEIFLLDEPLSNLDAELRAQMRIELSKLHSELQSTMIYVTHDQVEAMTLADKIIVLNGGKIEQICQPRDLYQRPANLFVAGFIGSPTMNFLKVRGEDTSAKAVVISGPDFPRRPLSLEKTISAEVTPGAELTLGLRPAHAYGWQPANGR